LLQIIIKAREQIELLILYFGPEKNGVCKRKCKNEGDCNTGMARNGASANLKK